MAADRCRSAAVELLVGRALYERVVAERLASARESIAIATANVKAMFVERGRRWVEGRGTSFGRLRDEGHLEGPDARLHPPGPLKGLGLEPRQPSWFRLRRAGET